MSLLVVGSIALDTVKTPKGELKEGLGGSATYFTIAASKFTNVSIVGVVGEDFPREYIELLRDCGANLDGLKVISGKTFRWHGVYEDEFGDPKTLLTELNVFEKFKPELPNHYKDLPFVFLANIHPALQLEVAKQMRKPKLIAADTIECWIKNEPDALREVISSVDMFFLNEAELRMITGQKSPLLGAEKLLSLGPEWIMLKRGVFGSMLIGKNGMFMLPAYPTTNVVDPTGAGDSFAGGMMGFIARVGDTSFDTMKKAVAYGTIMGSFCVEGFSTNRLVEVNQEMIKERLTELANMTRL